MDTRCGGLCFPISFLLFAHNLRIFARKIKQNKQSRALWQ